MRKVRNVLIVGILIMGLGGCTWAERKRVSQEANGLSAAFVSQMDKKQTTREQEQAFIRAADRNFYELDRSIRGTAAADQTRKSAQGTLSTNPAPTVPTTPAVPKQ